MRAPWRCWDSERVPNTGIVLLAVAAAIGWLLAVTAVVSRTRSRRAFTRALEERGWLMEREREAAAQIAVDAERARIARELHDIVSHNVSLMVIQAGAARQVLATEPSAATEAMLAVEAAGRDAMTELRHLLGVLAQSEPGADLATETAAPQPSLSRLTALIDRIAFAGLPVEVRISGEPRPLPPGIDVTAYRIIQEALTNAIKHGDGVGAEVTIRYADRYLRIEVLNSGPSVLHGGSTAPPAPDRRSDSPGRGLLGLRERVAVYGGDLDARRRLGGGYRVRARIPLAKP
jgi:signal transduction histidine kinase